jgi:hypothetical protein
MSKTRLIVSARFFQMFVFTEKQKNQIEIERKT